MAEATKDAGLTMNGTEEEMWKLMESGKLLAKDVIPAFAKELRKTATDGNSLAHALEFNLRVAVGRAVVYLQDLSNAIYTGGLASALKLVVDSFNEISPKITDAAFLFGKVLSGAIMGVTFPVVLLTAALTDLWTLTKMVTGVSDDMGASFLSLGAKAMGAYFAIRTVMWGLKKLLAMRGLLRAKDVLTTGGSGGKSTTINSPKGTDSPSRNRRFPKGKPTTQTSSNRLKMGVGGMGIGAVIASTITFNMADTFIDEFKDFSSRFWDGAFNNIEESFKTGNAGIVNSPRNTYLSPPQKLDINIRNTIDSEGNIQAFVDGRIENADIENQERALNSIGSLY